jgi:hypothetical protein
MHRLLLRVAHCTQSDGHAVRIIRFVTNAVGQAQGEDDGNSINPSENDAS